MSYPSCRFVQPREINYYMVSITGIDHEYYKKVENHTTINNNDYTFGGQYNNASVIFILFK